MRDPSPRLSNPTLSINPLVAESSTPSDLSEMLAAGRRPTGKNSSSEPSRGNKRVERLAVRGSTNVPAAT